MLRLSEARFYALFAVDNGIIDPTALQDFMDSIFSERIVTIEPGKLNFLSDFLQAVTVNETPMILMTKKGEIELLVLTDEYSKELAKAKIDLWHAHKANLSLNEQLEKKEAELAEYSSSFDHRLNDARNLISCYEQMADELNNIKITAQTLNRNIGIYRDDYDSLFIVWSLLCASIEHTSNNPTDYDDLPF